MSSPEMRGVMTALCEKFPEEKVKTRHGKGGMQYKYIPTQEIVNRLNDVLGCAWSAYEVDSMFIGQPGQAPSYVVKRVRIEVPDPEVPDRRWHRDGWGGHPMAGDAGDAMKSAYSKAFTKAASQFGIGLYLWGVDVDDDNAPIGIGYPPPQTNPSTGGFTPAPVPPGGSTGGYPVPNQSPQQGPPPPTPQFANPAHNQPPPARMPQADPGAGSPYPHLGTNAPPQGAAAFDYSKSTGYTSGPPSPGLPPAAPAAQLGFQSSGPSQPQQQAPYVQNSGEKPIQEFQVNAINGMAGTVDLNPLQAINETLGAEAANIQAVEQLTESQAIRVLQYLKQAASQS